LKMVKELRPLGDPQGRSGRGHRKGGRGLEAYRLQLLGDL